MAGFLKAIAVVYALFAVTIAKIDTAAQFGAIYVFIGCVVASIPAALIYAFGNVVEDVSEVREHFHALGLLPSPPMLHQAFLFKVLEATMFHTINDTHPHFFS